MTYRSEGLASGVYGPLSDSVPPAPRTAFVVLGVHRSGTSAMTRVLGLSGGRLPSDPQPAASDNERGFWESETVIALNEQILAACDSEWDDIFAGQPRRHLSNFDRVFRHRAAEVLDSVFGDADPIVLKDPRINVLAAFWDSALRAHGYEPLYVIMVRNPAEVAASLLERDQMPTDHGLLLWLDHILACERDTRQAKRLFVAYDDLLEDWRGCLDRVEKVWEKALPRRTSAAANTVERFLSPSLRHHRATERSLQSDLPVRRMAAEAYSWLQSATRSDTPVDGEALDGLRARLASLRETIEPLLSGQRARFNGQKARLAEYVVHTDALEAARAQLRREIEAAQVREETLLGQVEHLRAAATEQAEALDRRAALASLREQEQAGVLEDVQRQLSQAVAEAARHAEDLRAGQARDAELVSTRAELEEVRRQLAQALAEAARHAEDLRAAQARDAELASARDDLGRLREEVERRGEALDQLRAAVAAAQAGSAGQEDAIAERERTIADLRQALEDERANGGSEAELEVMESRYAVLSEELRRVQAVAEDGFSRARTLASKLKAETEQARTAETLREEREALLAEMRELRSEWAREAEDREEELRRRASEEQAAIERQVRELADLSEAHARDLQEQEERRTAVENGHRLELDDLRSDRAKAEREIEALRLERANILGSTSWKLAALPRRLISGLRRS